MPRRQSFDRKSALGRDPLIINSSSDDQRVICLAFVSEEAGKDQHVLGGDPCVRDVAEVPGAARVLPGNFRPLVPGSRTSIREEELKQLQCLSSFAQVDESANDANFVSGVVGPGHLAGVLPAKVTDEEIEQ